MKKAGVECSTSHHPGCPCHEAMWIERLDAERKEIVRLKMELNKVSKALEARQECPYGRAQVDECMDCELEKIANTPDMSGMWLSDRARAALEARHEFVVARHPGLGDQVPCAASSKDWRAEHALQTQFGECEFDGCQHPSHGRKSMQASKDDTQSRIKPGLYASAYDGEDSKP